MKKLELFDLDSFYLNNEGFAENESYNVEYKSAKGGLPSSLWETYSAFANSDGGVIFLGVENDGQVSGINNLEKIKKDFWSLINNKGKVSVNLLAESDLQEINQNNKTVLAIRVRKASRHERPVFIGQNPLTGTYRRYNEGDFHCSQIQVQKMIADASENPSDSKIMKGFSLSDLDISSLQQYRQRFASKNPTHSWLAENDENFLFKLGGFRKDREANEYGITLAAILMFGTDEAIREATNQQYNVDYQELGGERFLDRLTIDGTWCANLFQFCLRAYNKLIQDIKTPFQLDGIQRQDESPVHKAIREALVNSIIHASYRESGGVVAKKAKDYFEFANPGDLLIAKNELGKGITQCRNPSLQKMFQMIGFAEKAGSGINTINQGWESQNWLKPTVREITAENADRVIWKLPMTSLIQPESIEELEKLFGKKLKNCDTTEIQILAIALEEKEVKNSRIQEITNLHHNDISKILQNLSRQKMLVMQGYGRWARYKLPNQYETEKDLLDYANNEPDLDNYQSNLDNKGLDLENRSSNSHHNHNILDNKKLSLDNKLKARLSAQELEEIIQEICLNNWLTKKEIAKKINKSVPLLTKNLPKMIKKNLIKLKYPDKPNSSKQAYTTVKK
jgi:ATP-dependent DNA helicase RecG